MSTAGLPSARSAGATQEQLPPWYGFPSRSFHRSRSRATSSGSPASHWRPLAVCRMSFITGSVAGKYAPAGSKAPDADSTAPTPDPAPEPDSPPNPDPDPDPDPAPDSTPAPVFRSKCSKTHSELQ